MLSIVVRQHSIHPSFGGEHVEEYRYDMANAVEAEATYKRLRRIDIDGRGYAHTTIEVVEVVESASKELT